MKLPLRERMRVVLPKRSLPENASEAHTRKPDTGGITQSRSQEAGTSCSASAAEKYPGEFCAVA